MDKGAHFHKYDFQVHTPRDAGWAGGEKVGLPHLVRFQAKEDNAGRDSFRVAVIRPRSKTYNGHIPQSPIPAVAGGMGISRQKSPADTVGKHYAVTRD